MDTLPARIERRRIYILPTRFGLMLAALLAAMLIAGLNYNGNLALAFSFFMLSTVLVAMHHCHRNLLGLSVDARLEVDAHAGGDAVFHFMLRNESAVARHDVEVVLSNPFAAAQTRVQTIGGIAPGAYQETMLAVPVARRGVDRWQQFELCTTYPFGWFRAWTYVHAPLTAFVAPAPRGDRPLPAASSPRGRAAHAEAAGEEDFAGLRTYAPGMPLKHMAWKALARGGEAAVRIYTDLGQRPEWLDWAALEGLETESRLSQLCRWISQCESSHPRPYGLRLPGVELAPGQGAAHRSRCLRALACYGGTAP